MDALYSFSPFFAPTSTTSKSTQHTKAASVPRIGQNTQRTYTYAGPANIIAYINPIFALIKAYRKAFLTIAFDTFDKASQKTSMPMNQGRIRNMLAIAAFSFWVKTYC
jgi:hypothetical protein